MKLIKSFEYAYRGLMGAVKSQLNLRIHLTAAVAVIIAGFYFGITATEWTIILILIGIVISLELVNTAIEHLVDLITLERKPLAGKVKDIAAAAVIVSSLTAVVVGFIIFSKYINRL